MIPRFRTAALLLLLAVAHGPARSPAQPADANPAGDSVTIQMPNAQVSDVANFYETLTGRRLIRDNSLSGAPLTIEVQQPVSKAEAIAMIEASLLLNGYSIIHEDEHKSKLIGPTKPPRNESVPLYTHPSQLPGTEQIVSYFMPFRYVPYDEAAVIFGQYVQPRPGFGGIVPVPSVNALVITENTPLVRRLIDLKSVIDVQGAKTATEFFTLERADAERVAEILDKVLNDESGKGTGVNRTEPVNAAPPNPANPAAQPPGMPATLVSATPAKVQVIADTRTNRVMVVAPEGQMAYIRDLVHDLDLGVEFEEPLERLLKFANAGEVLPVLANLLTEGKEDETTKSEGGADIGGGELGATGGGGDYGGAGGGGSASKPDLLRERTESTAPESIIVGKSRIIADRAANKIIVIGPPESRSKAAKVLDMLDQQPKQVYLAVIIGQLRLGKGVEFGIDYLMRFGDVRILGQGTTGNVGNLLTNRVASVDLLPGATDAVDTAAAITRTALPAAAGLTVFGSIADSVDILARALGTDDRFEVISRPVVYTVNNKKAVISSGTEQPVPTSTLSSLNQTNSNVDTNTALQSNIEFKPVVLKLEVIPLINSDKEVTLQIAQQNDNVQGTQTISGNDVPIISTQELRTTVTVPNRHTIVLGGLITNEETRAATGIPFLKDIPGLGYLFSSTKKDHIRRELIVLIQPFIINSRQDLQEANYIERSDVSFREGLFDKPVDIRPAELPPPENVRIGN